MGEFTLGHWIGAMVIGLIVFATSKQGVALLVAWRVLRRRR